MTAAICWWLDESGTEIESDRAEAATLQIETVDRPPATGFYLARTERGLTLFRAATDSRDASYHHDLLTTIQQRSDGPKNNPLARACGLHRRKGLSVFDATAGLGRDSSVLAALGCSITAVERHSVPAALTRDALYRAHAAGELVETWPALDVGEAAQKLASQTNDLPDVVYLDPMFSAPRRRAKPQKPIAWLGELMGPDTDTDALLRIASQTARQRVVVKRHARQPSLGSPSFEVGKRAIRFDVYVTPS